MITSHDLRAAANAAMDSLSAFSDADWSALACDLEWTCRRTADHISDALMFYSVQLATRSPNREPRVRKGNPSADIADVIGAIGSAAAILARLADEAGPAARGFHTAGLADTEGFLAMGCDEILIHTHDVVCGLGGTFTGESGIAARVAARLFPWAPEGHGPWETLLWCNGRIPLPGHDRLGTDWFWECAPLSEWDGTVRKRQS